jgi:hypothetical protein
MMSKLGGSGAGVAFHTTGEIGAIPSATRPGVSERRAALALPRRGPTAEPDWRLGDGRSLMALYGAEAVTIDRNAGDFKVPDQIRAGQEVPAYRRLCLALLPSPVCMSNPQKGPNAWSQPYSHALDDSS